MGDLRGKIVCKQVVQVMIWQTFLIEREEMHTVLLLHLREGDLRRSREDDHSRDFTRDQPLHCFVVVVIRALHGNLETVENDVGGHLGLAVLQVEVHFFVSQTVIGLDVVSREHLKLGIVKFREILNSLLDIGVEDWILFLEEPKIVLVDDGHIYVLEEQNVVQVLESAVAKNRKDTDAIGAQVIDDVADVLGES